MLLADLVGKDRMRNDFDPGHGPVQFEETPRHVIPGGDQTQTVKTLLSHPLCRFPGVAQGIVRVVAERRAARSPIRGVSRNPKEFVQIDLLIDPRYEELASFSIAQEIHPALQAQTSAGQHNDRIGCRQLILGQGRVREPDETGDPWREKCRAGDRCPAQSTP